MRLGIHLHDEVVQEPHDGLLARGQIRERRIFHREAALAHRAVHRDDRVARHAAEPGLRFGRDSMILRMGVSIMPLNSSAGSWQPPHHFDGFTPTTSCMYSMLLRYHWLLNDEKWCAEPHHWW